MDNRKDLMFNSHATTRSAIVPYTAAAYTAANIVLSQRSCMTSGCEFMHVTRPRRRRERGHGQRWPLALRVLSNMKLFGESERMGSAASSGGHPLHVAALLSSSLSLESTSVVDAEPNHAAHLMALRFAYPFGSRNDAKDRFASRLPLPRND